MRARITRWLGLLPALLLPFFVCAQPSGPDLTFLLVRDATGRPMKGPYAENAMLREALLTKAKDPWWVELHFTVGEGYAYGPEKPGDHKWWPLIGSAMQTGDKDQLVFRLFDCWCTDFYVRVIQGDRIMRIDLPDAPADRWALVQRVMARSGDYASPEVFRFRAGRFSFAELAADPAFDRLEQGISQRLEQAMDADYRLQLADQEEYYRTHPPKPPPAPVAPPPTTPSTEAIEREIAQGPGLKEVRVDSVVAGNVWVSISGRVMLNGGCGSGMPLYGVEIRADSGWVQRIPFNMEQMDCGMPWADWDEHTVMIPLAWWVRARSREGGGELKSGTYRLLFLGANRVLSWTGAFRVL